MSCFERDTAGKLRGDLQWFFSMVSGFAGKIAAPVLRRRFQKADLSELDQQARVVLSALRRMVECASPRQILVNRWFA